MARWWITQKWEAGPFRERWDLVASIGQGVRKDCPKGGGLRNSAYRTRLTTPGGSSMSHYGPGAAGESGQQPSSSSLQATQLPRPAPRPSFCPTPCPTLIAPPTPLARYRPTSLAPPRPLRPSPSSPVLQPPPLAPPSPCPEPLSRPVPRTKPRPHRASRPTS